MEDIAEYSRRLTFKELPIKLPAAKFEKANGTVKKLTLPEILRAELSDEELMQRLSTEKCDELIARLQAKHGKTATRLTVQQVISTLRKGIKNRAELKEQLKEKGIQVRRKAAARKPARATAGGETFRDLFLKLEAAVESIINERDQALAQLSRIREAIR